MSGQVLYGFTNLEQLKDRRVTEVGVAEVGSMVEQAMTEHQRQMASITALFCRPTTDFKTRFRTPTVARLQPLDENGRARPIAPAGQYDLSFPLQMAGSADGANWVTMAKATVGEVADRTASQISADLRWVRDHILAALYTNVAWTWPDPLRGDLTIKGLANNDTDTYNTMTGAEGPATDNHYYAQSTAIADANNPYTVIYDELIEHPENAGEIVALVPSDLIATTKALTNFVEVSDANVVAGANQARLVGELGVATPGVVIGYVGRVWIVEWRSLPSSYIIGLSTAGEKPLAMREDPEPELRGFNMVAERNDHPWYERQWVRRAGFGAFNRVGAVVYRIGNASYAIPTGFSSPMP